MIQLIIVNIGSPFPNKFNEIKQNIPIVSIMYLEWLSWLIFYNLFLFVCVLHSHDIRHADNVVT